MGRDGEGRNPYWLAAGLEAAGGEILWSQPEVALFDRYHSVPEAGGCESPITQSSFPTAS